MNSVSVGNKRKREEPRNNEVIASPEYQRLHRMYWELYEKHINMMAEYNEYVFSVIKKDLKKE